MGMAHWLEQAKARCAQAPPTLHADRSQRRPVPPSRASRVGCGHACRPPTARTESGDRRRARAGRAPPPLRRESRPPPAARPDPRRDRHGQGACSPTRFTAPAAAPPARSWTSTARRSPRRCWKRSCSASSAARSPTRARPRPGLFQAARGGTIFLDEIGLLPLALQAKLLKVIEERAVRRLGSTRSEPVDAAVIAATSEDLAAAVERGRFRADLYHRLAVVTLVLPPLRARGRDVVLLAEHFLARACEDYGLPPLALATTRARRCWPTRGPATCASSPT